MDRERELLKKIAQLESRAAEDRQLVEAATRKSEALAQELKQKDRDLLVLSQRHEQRVAQLQSKIRTVNQMPPDRGNIDAILMTEVSEVRAQSAEERLSFQRQIAFMEQQMADLNMKLARSETHNENLEGQLRREQLERAQERDKAERKLIPVQTSLEMASQSINDTSRTVMTLEAELGRQRHTSLTERTELHAKIAMLENELVIARDTNNVLRSRAEIATSDLKSHQWEMAQLAERAEKRMQPMIERMQHALAVSSDADDKVHLMKSEVIKQQAEFAEERVMLLRQFAELEGKARDAIGRAEVAEGRNRTLEGELKRSRTEENLALKEVERRVAPVKDLLLQQQRRAEGAESRCIALEREIEELRRAARREVESLRSQYGKLDSAMESERKRIETVEREKAEAASARADTLAAEVRRKEKEVEQLATKTERRLMTEAERLHHEIERADTAELALRKIEKEFSAAKFQWEAEKFNLNKQHEQLSSMWEQQRKRAELYDRQRLDSSNSRADALAQEMKQLQSEAAQTMDKAERRAQKLIEENREIQTKFELAERRANANEAMLASAHLQSEKLQDELDTAQVRLERALEQQAQQLASFWDEQRRRAEGEERTRLDDAEGRVSIMEEKLYQAREQYDEIVGKLSTLELENHELQAECARQLETIRANHAVTSNLNLKIENLENDIRKTRAQLEAEQLTLKEIENEKNRAQENLSNSVNRLRSAEARLAESHLRISELEDDARRQGKIHEEALRLLSGRIEEQDRALAMEKNNVKHERHKNDELATLLHNQRSGAVSAVTKTEERVTSLSEQLEIQTHRADDATNMVRMLEERIQHMLAENVAERTSMQEQIVRTSSLVVEQRRRAEEAITRAIELNAELERERTHAWQGVLQKQREALAVEMKNEHEYSLSHSRSLAESLTNRGLSVNATTLTAPSPNTTYKERDNLTSPRKYEGEGGADGDMAASVVKLLETELEEQRRAFAEVVASMTKPRTSAVTK